MDPNIATPRPASWYRVNRTMATPAANVPIVAAPTRLATTIGFSKIPTDHSQITKPRINTPPPQIIIHCMAYGLSTCSINAFRVVSGSPDFVRSSAGSSSGISSSGISSASTISSSGRMVLSPQKGMVQKNVRRGVTHRRCQKRDEHDQSA